MEIFGGLGCVSLITPGRDVATLFYLLMARSIDHGATIGNALQYIMQSRKTARNKTRHCSQAMNAARVISDRAAAMMRFPQADIISPHAEPSQRRDHMKRTTHDRGR